MTKMQLAKMRAQRIHGPIPASTPTPALVKGGPFSTFGAQLLAIAHAGDHPDTTDKRLYEVRAPIGGSEQIPADGGFAVQPEFAETIASKVYLQGELISRMTHFTTTKDWASGLKLPAFDEQSRADGSRFGAVASAWQNESDTLTASKPRYRVMELTLKKLTALGYTTEELFTDSAVLEQALTLAYVNEFTYKFEKAALFGTGSGMPQGISNTNALITVSKESGQAAATVLSQNILNMHARMWGPSRSRACWVINQNIEQNLIPLVYIIGNAGAALPLYHPAESDDEPFARMLGRPVIPVEYCPTLGQVGDIAFVDFSQYLFLEKREGIERAVSMHLKFLSDEMTFRWTWRCDGQPMWHTAVTPANGTATLSPYVTLAVR
jgi:HK97 family phage major capsid protein